MILNKFKFFEHASDLKFQAYGKSVEEVFANSAYALKKIICGKKQVKKDLIRIIEIKGKDMESLLYNFLEEIIYLLEAENFLIAKINKIEFKEYELKLIVEGDKTSNYQITSKVKAVTYKDIFLKQDGKKWISQVVVDV